MNQDKSNNKKNSNNVFLTYYDDSFDINEILGVLDSQKKLISIATLISVMISLLYAFTATNIYTSSALLKPTEKSGNNISSMMSQYSGLANLAGISMQNNSNGSDAQLAISLLQSNVFLSNLIQSRGILPELVAAKSWNPNTKILSYDKNKYDSKKRIWNNQALNNLPSNQQAYNSLLERIFIIEDTKTNYITLAVEHLSPEVARQWVQWLIEDVNSTIANKQINQAKNSISYLETQIKLTPYAELRSMFYEIIQQQTQIMMLANVRDEFALTTIDPAIAPEHKSRPSKSIILIIGTLFGLISSILCTLIHFFYKKNKVTV